MSIRFTLPGRRPFYITSREDGFMMALIRDGKFVGWREKGTRFATREEAWKVFDKAFGIRPDLVVAKIV